MAKDPRVHTDSDSNEYSSKDRNASIVEAHVAPPTKDVQMKTFMIYFSEWRHLKQLIGTASCWFLVDVAFYGLNLNQSVLLAAIGFSKGKTEFDTLLKNAYGNLIIAAAGYVPGYFLTIFFIEILGRRWIQIQGFLVCALMFGIIAGDYAHLGTAGKFVCFTIAQVSQDLAYQFGFIANQMSLVILQLRSQRHHLHRSRRALPLTRSRLCPRCQCRDRKTRCHSIRRAVQLPEFTR